MARTVIIGAGINGMLLGALLAREGGEVLVFEKKGRIGGRAFLYERDGFVADYGVHLTRFGPESAVARIFRRLGRPVEFKRMGPSYVLDADGSLKLFPTSPAGIFKSGLFTPGEKLKILGMLLSIKKGKYNDLMDVPLSRWMEEHRVTGGLAKYFRLLSASVMVCPFIERTSAGEMFRNISKVLATGHSAEYPAGGWKPLHKALVEEIVKAGRIITGTKASSIIVKGGRARGVRAGGKSYPADRVVINVPVQEMTMLLPPSAMEKGYARRCRDLLPTAGVFLDAALGKSVSPFSGLLYTMEPVVYGCVTSNITHDIAPVGKQLVTLFYPTALEDVRDPKALAKRKKELDKALLGLFPGIEKDILWKRVVALRMVDGVQVNVDQTEDKRPGVRVPGIEGLFLVGDSVGAPGAGGDVGNESVLLAYRAMTGKDI